MLAISSKNRSRWRIASHRHFPSFACPAGTCNFRSCIFMLCVLVDARHRLIRGRSALVLGQGCDVARPTHKNILTGERFAEATKPPWAHLGPSSQLQAVSRVP